MEVIQHETIGIGSTALSGPAFRSHVFVRAGTSPAQHAEENKAPHEEQSAKPAQPAPTPNRRHRRPSILRRHSPRRLQNRTETAKPAERTAKTEQAKPATQHAQTATRTSPAARTTASTRTTSTARTQNTQSVQRSEQAHNFGGHGGGHIADARFSASFGRAHSFHTEPPHAV